MFECTRCEYEDTEYCGSCFEIYCKPSNWKRKREDIDRIMKENKGIDNSKIK